MTTSGGADGVEQQEPYDEVEDLQADEYGLTSEEVHLDHDLSST